MKKSITVFIVFSLYSTICFCQTTYSFNSFQLNSKVSYNSILNFYNGDIEMVTSPSVYETGEEIVFKDKYGMNASFRYFEGTQILHCIFLSYENKTSYSDTYAQWTNAISQLGIPTRGYEVKKTHYDPSALTEFFKKNVTYAGSYEYCYNDYEIDISYYAAGCLGNESGTSIVNLYSFSACLHKSKCDSYGSFYPKALTDNDKVEFIKKF